MIIPYSKPYYTGHEVEYIRKAMENSKLSGNGIFTQKCEALLEQRYDVARVLLTTSCTDALEIAAHLIDIQPGDEVIVPSFTFVSTANAFALKGAKIVFADSLENHPNICVKSIRSLITEKTKAIIPVHYAGVPCDMAEIMEIADEHNIYVIEDAAQAIESNYNGKQLGTIGHMGVFSFHDTKNICSGEGGALLLNDKSFIEDAEIIREKGTNRSAFVKGEVDKYGWVSLGSSHIISELSSAFLFAQLREIDSITKLRQAVWDRYDQGIQNSSLYRKPLINDKANAHIYFLEFFNGEIRDKALQEIKQRGVQCTFHFLPLEQSEYAKLKFPTDKCQHSTYFSNAILRLPMYSGLTNTEIDTVINTVNNLKF